MKRLALAILLCAAITPSAMARNDFVEYDTTAALAAEHHENMLSDIPAYMKEQAHPEVARSIDTYRSNRPSRSAMTSDESACQRAFLSAVISLQTRAKTEGGNAVIDIVSDTYGGSEVAAGKYRCIVGNIVARVALSGTAVVLKR